MKVFNVPFQDNSQIVNKEKELVKLGDLLVKLEEKSNTDTEAVKTAQEHFHAVSAGLSSNDDGEDKTLADQIMSMFFGSLWLFKRLTSLVPDDLTCTLKVNNISSYKCHSIY